jgi:hypothetical protein
MSFTNTNYIEINSAYRDRTRYPNPCNFDVELGTTRSNNSFCARDPVFSSVMKYPVPNKEFPITYPDFGYMYGAIFNGNSPNSPNGTSDTIIGILPVTQNYNRQLSLMLLLPNEGGYVGNTLELIESTISGVVVASNQFRTIVGYKAIPFTLINPFSLNTTIPEQYLTSTVDGTLPITSNSISLNLTTDIFNFYHDWTLQFVKTTDPTLLNVTRQISYYRAFDKRVFWEEPIASTITAGDIVLLSVPLYEVEINSPFSIGALSPLIDNSILDNNTTYRIRTGTNIPLNQGTISAGTSTTFTLDPLTFTNINYSGCMIWIKSDPIAFSGVLSSASFITSGGIQVQGIFVLNGAGAFTDGFFNNMTLTLTSGVYSGQSYIISSWVQSTQTGTVDPSWSANILGSTNPSIGDSYEISQPSPSNYRLINSYDISTHTGTTVTPFSYINVKGMKTIYSLTTNDTYDILKFDFDNYCPLSYNDSVTANQQPHCYELSLISLILPNVPLHRGVGGILKNYSYLYVEFNSVTQGTAAYDFSSNNPAATNAMFRVPIVYSGFYQNFVPLISFEMTQLLKFKPNDSFKFKVTLPNGQLLLTEGDFMSPSSTNEYLQISACFGFKRVILRSEQGTQQDIVLSSSEISNLGSLKQRRMNPMYNTNINFGNN